MEAEDLALTTRVDPFEDIEFHFRRGVLLDEKYGDLGFKILLCSLLGRFGNVNPS